MRAFFFISLLYILNAAPVTAQNNNEKEKVHRAMMDYIEAFYEGDTSKIMRSILPSVTKYGYMRNRNGGYIGEPMSFQEMIDYVIGVSKNPKKAKVGPDEKVEIYDILDQTASGKVTAWWGTDYILLEKVKDKWMIKMVLWQSPVKN